ncbi:AsnC family transcriptional regulator [Arthrobacter sp. BF1]
MGSFSWPLTRELYSDARMPNNILAARANLAPSTCLNRVETIT